MYLAQPLNEHSEARIIAGECYQSLFEVVTLTAWFYCETYTIVDQRTQRTRAIIEPEHDAFATTKGRVIHRQLMGA